MFTKSTQFIKAHLLAGFLAITVICSSALPPQSSDAESAPKAPPAKPAPNQTSPAAAISAWRTFEAPYFKRKWGVEIVGVRAVSSGSMIEFRYKVLDSKKAAMLNDKRWNPYLEDLASGAKLAVPTMEKVGQLRQVPPPEDGRV